VKTISNALTNLMKLRGVSYLMKEEYKGKGFGEGVQIGLIAQEIENIYSEIVTTNKKIGIKV
jgi:hypothetical protein